jgi:hypothetical protein
MNQDQEHLKLIAIFHYVVAGMAALFACFPLVHFGIGLALSTGWLPANDPESRFIGVIFMVIAGLFVVAGWVYAALMVVAGRCVATRRRRTFCLVMAAVSCLFMPFGTVLGIFTIIVLMRESVVALFDGQPAPRAG